jgi:DNA-binding MarR family transcriptional regulator
LELRSDRSALCGRDVNSRLRQIADLDRLIHEPARLMIAATLYLVKEADFLYLQDQTELTKGNLSSHLAKLEEAGYVEIEKTYRGKIPMTVCRLTKKGRASFKAYEAAVRGAFLEPMSGVVGASK